MESNSKQDREMRINRNNSSASQVHQNLKNDPEYIIALELGNYDYMQLILASNGYNATFDHASAIIRFAKGL
jgi:hypothetical protein